MKKTKRFILSFVLILVACVSLFAGCGTNLKGGPNLTDAVTSNGGLVVQKGEYLYFVNGTVEAKDANNKYGNARQAAIYRAKLNNNQLSYDEENNLKDVELVVPKIVGFEKAGMFIYGNHIYYATPNTEKNKSTGEVDTKLLDFYRINLNGTGNTRLYKTTVSTDNTKFAFYEINGTVYLTVYDTEKVVIVNCKEKSSTIVAENVSSAILPLVTEYNPSNNTISKMESRVYYTRSAKEEENNTGNVIAYIDIANPKDEKVVSNLNPTAKYTLKELSYVQSAQGENQLRSKGYLLYTSNESGSELYYTANIENDEIVMDTQTKLTVKAQKNNVYLYTDKSSNNSQKGLITTNDNGNLTLITMKNNYEEKAVVYNELGSLTILSVKGSKIFYYNSNNQLFMFDIESETQQATQLTQNDETYKFSIISNFDMCGEYVYLFKNFTGKAPEAEGENAKTGSYLIRIKYLNNEVYEDEFLGYMLEEHIPEQETEE